MGRCHDAILKVEQLYSLKNVSDGLNEITSRIGTCLDTNNLQFGIIKKQFRTFLDNTHQRGDKTTQ